MPATAALALTIASLLRDPAYAHAHYGLAVYDLDRHRTIYSVAADRLYDPASTTKLLTTGMTLGALGPQFRFKTPVYRTGDIDAQGTLHGDLVLVASGDANLSQRIAADGTLAFEDEDHSYDGSPRTKAVPGDPLAVLRDLARQAYARGIRRVDGRVVVDASLFPDAGPENGTGVDVSPIVVNDNIVDVIVAPGKHPGDAAAILSISPATPYASFVNKATTGAPRADSTLSMTDGDDGKGNRVVTVSGSVASTDPPTLYAYRVPSPPRFAEEAFTLALRDAGVAIADPPADPPSFDRSAYAPSYRSEDLVAEHVSPPIREDVRVTLKVSDNLHADLMPYVVGVYAGKTTGPGALQAGFDVERAFLLGQHLDITGAAQQDGAGTAAFTPSFMVHYLAALWNQSWFGDIHRGLPILGVDGTLATIATTSPAKGKVFAKTGTSGMDNYLSRGDLVDKGLAGYMTTRAGHHIAFCSYIGNAVYPHGVDGSEKAGQFNGAVANAIYLHE